MTGSRSKDQCTKDSCSTGDCSTCSSAPRLPPGILSEYDINARTSDGILTWAEVNDDGMMESSVYGVLGRAKEMNAGRSFAILFGGVERKILYNDLFEHGVDTIYHIRNTSLDKFRPDDYATAINDVSDRIVPSAIFISGTVRGKELAPIVADKTGMGCFEDIGDMNVPHIVLFANGVLKIPERETGRRGTVMNRQFRPSD